MRKQKTLYMDELSNTADILYGVPQGSILGPLLFFIYINDVVNSSKLLNFSLFADDKTAFMCDNNSSSLFRRVNRELVNVNDWVICNKLSLNMDKTVFMLFTNVVYQEPFLPLKIGNAFIEFIKLNFWDLSLTID